MQSILFQTICKIGIFMICAQAIIHFRPRETYEKYLKLLVSAMILIQLFLPIGSFLLGGGMEQTLKRLEQLRTQLEQEMDSAAREAADTDKLLEQMTLEEIRKRVEEQERLAEEAGEVQKGAGDTRSGTGDTRNGAGEGPGRTEDSEDGIEEVPEVTVTVGPIEIQ